MNAELPKPETPLTPHLPAPLPGWRRALVACENFLLVFVLAVAVLLPVAEIVLRKFFNGGIAASTTVVQHLTLLIGVFGGAIAAREDRLLAISATSTFLKGVWLRLARVCAHAFGAAVSVFLCVASGQFVSSTRPLGKILAWGVPIWVVQFTLVLGFAAIAARLIRHAAASWRGRLAALALTGGLVAVAVWAPLDPASLRVPALLGLLGATILGAPLFVTLGGAALILLWSGGEPIASVPLSHYRLVTNPTLPSIPLFTLAGYFLAEGGASRRLIAVFQAWFGWVRGGPAIVTALVCAFFTSFTGASGVTILALGGLLMPVLVSARFAPRTALGLLTSAGALGVLFPPCLPPILYSVIANTSAGANITIEEMFQGGLLPGLLLVGTTAAWGCWAGPGRAADAGAFDARAAWAAVRAAKWELLIPVVALVTLFSGFATPVEAAAVTAAYACFVEVVVHRDLHWLRDVPRVMTECGLLVGGVLLILGVALGLTHYLIDAQVPDRAVAWATGTLQSKLTFLLALNVFLLIVGCLMDIYSAIVVVVPLLVPLGVAFGIDPVHLGVIFLANLELGFLTPPVGMNLFLASYRFNQPVPEVTRAVLPLLAVRGAVVLLVTYVPVLTTWLPGLFRS
jgi:tripartite ATP-independent transporter DctM subunit